MRSPKPDETSAAKTPYLRTIRYPTRNLWIVESESESIILAAADAVDRTRW